MVLVHDLIPAFHGPRLRRRAWTAFFRRSLLSADRLLVYSDATEERVEQLLGRTPASTTRIELTASSHLVEKIRSERRTARGRRHLLCVGQLKPHKNVPALVEAFARSSFRSGGGRLVVVGPVGDPAPVLGAVERSGATDQVTLLGRQSEEALVELYATAAAVVQPSLEEGFGLPVAEALSAGIPVACSDISAHRGIAGDVPVWFDPRNIEAMAQAIDRAVALDDDRGWVGALDRWIAQNPLQAPTDLAAKVRDVIDEELRLVRRRPG